MERRDSFLMELTTVIGMVLGAVSVLGAMYFKHLSLSIFNNPAALFVIFVGTISTIFTSYPAGELKNIGALFKILFTKKKGSHDTKYIIETMVSLATEVRKEGLLSLEAKITTIDDPFIQKGLKLVVDGAPEDFILDVLMAEIEAMEERHSINAGIFASAGMYAPTLGVLGAVFGLIAAMGSLSDTEMMAHAIAAAFMATVLGIFTGYVMWNPFATKLKIQSKHEVMEKHMIIEGVLSLQKGEPPVRVKEKLVALLPEKEQVLMRDEKE